MLYEDEKAKNKHESIQERTRTLSVRVTPATSRKIEFGDKSYIGRKHYHRFDFAFRKICFWIMIV